MSIKPKLIFVSNFDDWEGLYVDEKLISQGHRLDLIEILRLLGFTVDIKEISCDRMYKPGALPDKLTDELKALYEGD